MQQIAKKVLLIGWDAADWKFLTPLMEEGLMPNLTKLVEGGVKGRLATLDPPLSPTLWTSIATGKRPYKHGVHGFTEVDPSGQGVRPIYNTSRKVKAIWNILTQNKLRSNVVGWWPSHPAEPIDGVMVSNFFQRATAPLDQPWPLPKGTVYPEALADTLAECRVHPHELTAAHIQPFVPNAYKVDQRQDQRLQAVAKITADCSSIHAATTYLMENTEWDLTAVYLDAIDHYCHGFMKYHPPHRPHIPLQDYEMYKEVVKGGCRYHDMMLGRLMKLAGDDTTIILISDHGFHPDHNRPLSIPKEPSGPAVEHSPYGIVVMNGPGIKQDELLFGASLLDITPTLLTLLGLPVAEDMDGKVLLSAFQEPPVVEVIPSWENVAGHDGSHPEQAAQSQEAMQAELQQLIDLGYIDDPGPNLEVAIKNTRNENNYNLARAYLDGGQWPDGISLLEDLHTENPHTLRYAIWLIHAYQHTSQYKQARKVVEHVRAIADRESIQLDVLEGTLLLAEGRYKKALQLFQKAEGEAEYLPHIHLRIAHAYIHLNRFEEAKRVLEKALAHNPESFNAWQTLGLTNMRMMQYEAAAAAFLKAIGLMYYSPAVHYYLGEALLSMACYEEAANAFKSCLKLAPEANKARQRLISIYEQYLQTPGKAIPYKHNFAEKLDGEIVIVSGLPRSGTSMMMQMLEAGGLDVFTDQERQADDNNPKGYYEHEAVKHLHKNGTWLKEANGKAVKVIAQLLPFLPLKYRYKVVFMERDIHEVIQSQQRMLIRDGKKTKTDTLPLHLVQQYQRTIQQVKTWADKHANVEIHFVDYAAVVDQAFPQAIALNSFLDKGLHAEQMVACVDARLYRERLENAAL